MVKIFYDMEHYNYCHNHSELLSYQVCYHIIIVLRHIAIYIYCQLVAHETVKRFPEEVPSLANLARPATPLRPPEDPSRLGKNQKEQAPDIATVELVAVVFPCFFKGID